MDESIVITTLRAGSPSITAPIYSVVANQDTARPFIVVTLVSAVPVNNFDDPPTLDNRRVQVDCYAETYKAAKQLLQQCRTRLETIGHMLGENPSDYEDDTKLFRASADFSLWLTP